jgi:dipeptidyl aminopeptidase/acylaminoacyl peptidase
MSQRLAARSGRIIFTLYCIAFSCHAAADEARARVPVEDFFQAPILSEAQLSPDGQRVALKVRSKEKDARARLAVLDIKTLKSVVVAASSDNDIRQFHWVGEHRLVFDFDVELTGPARARTGAGMYSIDDDGTHYRALVDSLNSFVKSGNDDPELLPWNTFILEDRSRLFHFNNEMFVLHPEEFHLKNADYIRLQRVNTRNGRMREIDAPEHAVSWMIDRNGTLRAVVTHHEGVVRTQVRDEAGAWKILTEFDALDGGLTPTQVAPDGKIYFTGRKDRDKDALYVYDPATGKIADKPLLASEQYDIHPVFLGTRDKLLGVRYTVDAEVTQWIDPGMKAVQKSVDDKLTSTVNRISVAQADVGSTVLVESFSDRQPPVFRLYDIETAKFTLLGGTLPGISPKQMGSMDMVRYKARDGLEIPAYLTLPAGRAAKALPLVVLVHGGPFVRGATWGWNAEVQFLASRGYAVLQPEFRGSTGFGNQHFTSGWKQWGLAMQNDVADGARWAIAQGIADPKRICIAGASYGGYATLMGLVNDPDVFRCGVEWVGVTDLRMLYTVDWSDFSDAAKKYGLPRLVGDPTADAAQFKATSPIENAARIKQPLLMAYGGYDVRVPIVHGEKFRDAIKPFNQNVEWVVYGDEPHGWFKPETRVDFWTRVEKFLDRNLAVP